MKIKIKNLLISWDTLTGIFSAILFRIAFPGGMSISGSAILFDTSITVLALIFSIFFAALAVLISAGDNEFVRFLNQNGLYKQILFRYKYSIIVLFISLLISIGLRVLTIQLDSQANLYFPSWSLAVYSCVLIYSLVCSLLSILDSVIYAEKRAIFVGLQKDKKHEK